MCTRIREVYKVPANALAVTWHTLYAFYLYFVFLLLFSVLFLQNKTGEGKMP